MDSSGPVGWTTFFLNDSDVEQSVMVPMAICMDTTP